MGFKPLTASAQVHLDSSTRAQGGLNARWAVYDTLASMLVVVSADGLCLHVNSVCEDRFGHARKSLIGQSIFAWFEDARELIETLKAVAQNDYTTGRLQAMLRRQPSLQPEDHEESGQAVPVHVVVHQVEGDAHVLIEMLEFEQQWRQQSEQRVLDQARETKELVRHLAHEIKNPLGGIRGAAQLLGMELADGDHPRALADYARVIVREADRLQALVDRLLAPHRSPHVVGDVNIHEVCERVRSLLLAEFAHGLTVVRDYDASIPEFRGHAEALIQAVLNIAHNAAQALPDRILAGDARIILRTRVARRITIGKQLWRLALELQVEDNGPGIPAELQDRIFMPLVSGREGGSGLGLTLAQHFVQQHDGLVACESRPGRTVFKILIPLP